MKTAIMCILLIIVFSISSCSLRGKSDFEKLCEALKNRDVPSVERLIKKNPALIKATVGKWGDTLLNYAVMNDDIAMVDFLTKSGAEVNAGNQCLQTPLYLVLIYSPANKQAIATHLINAGADVNAKDVMGKTILMQAAKTGDLEIAKLLISAGADVNDKDKNNSTSLHEAARFGRKKMIELLMASKADLNVKDKEGNTPIKLAMRNGHIEAVNVLKTRGARIENITVFEAAALGDIESAKRLFDKNPEILKRKNKEDGDTPLHYAARKGQNGMIRFLLSRGADIEATNSHMETPLCSAVSEDNLETTEILLSQGARINSVDKTHRSPLSCAVFSSGEEMITLLLNRGADAKIMDSEGDTVLHKAVLRKNVNILKLLMARGADINLKNKEGATPLFGAVCESYVMKDSFGMYPTNDKNEDLIAFFISNSVDLNVRDKSGHTPLYYAKKYRPRNISDLLKKHGAIE
ncbi:MAG: ankyrin repeat domain-containing protein [Candidatus Eremiobacteraeota bacterium]|nr:ankyrin repeat domain-containing protein [Candidatus Eremiobacteraeota bacterium]